MESYNTFLVRTPKLTIFWAGAPNFLVRGGKIFSTGFARGPKILEPALALALAFKKLEWR